MKLSWFLTSLCKILKGLPHYRYLATTPERKMRVSTFPRPKSDPNLFKVSGNDRARAVPVPLDEPVVHGGEYTVRPNREESMTFLKKLFTHQQEGAKTTLSPFMSPPDSPRCKCLLLVGTICYIFCLTRI